MRPSRAKHPERRRPDWTIVALLIAILPICSQVYSQRMEFQARIIDSSSYQAIAFSTIYLGEYRGTISDEMGFFRIQFTREDLQDTLHISCIGYESEHIPVAMLQKTGLDTIYLHPGSVELSEIEVTAKGKRSPGSRQIIRMAVRNILNNYPTFPLVHTGYYREYIKSGGEYINLFESILNIADPGYQSVDNFNAGLLYKRVNRQFQVDSLLMRPYDNTDKFVPFSIMPIALNNELLILRAHDPVRNFNKHSLYFIERLERDFVRNHDFSAPKLTYLDDRPFFLISMKDNQKYRSGGNRIYTSGSIYIDAYNYGIKRIEYESTMDNGVSRRRLFGLNLEYALENDVYLLHYLSFNNLFYTRNFALVKTGIGEDQVILTFNRPVDEMYEGNPENISVFLEGEKQEIRNIDIQQSTIYLSFPKNSTIGERLKINLWPRNLTTRHKISRNLEFLKENLSFDILEMKDVYGNELADNELNEYYQYREFFTRQTDLKQEGITTNLIDKSIPVIDNRIFGSYTGDTSWLNTPLIREDISFRNIYSKSPELNKFIEQMYLSSDSRLDEVVYIQTDREVYAPEDTLWFKAYVRNKKFLTGSELSKVFHVLLVNEDGGIVHQGKYLVEDSGAKGHIELEHTLEEGIYYLSGYSSWMENFETGALFSKRILVEKEKRDGHLLAAAFDRSAYFPGDTVRMLVNCYNDFNQSVDDVSFRFRLLDGTKVIQRGQGTTGRTWLEPISFVLPEALNSQPRVAFRSIYASEVLDTLYSLPLRSNLHLDFFPEGGSCLNGVHSRIAYMARDGRGEPVDIEGELIDETGHVLATTASVHNGMGAFRITPEKDQAYYLRITDPPALGKRFELPQGKESGWQLQLEQKIDDGELELKLNQVRTGNDTALITLAIRGYLCYHKLVRVRGKIVVNIPLDDLPPGVAVITLFDNQLIPRAERLVYIPPSDRVSASLMTDRQQYLTRDSVLLTVHMESDLPLFTGGSFALSVIDNQLGSAAAVSEPGIVSALLGSGEIHGSVSNPDYYFNSSNSNAGNHLDLLCLTQGWRNYNYNLYAPENRDVISGKLIRPALRSDAKPVEGRIVVRFGDNTTSIPVKNDGTFSFLPEYSPQISNELYLYGEDKRGRSNLSIVLNSSSFKDDLEAYLHYLTDSLGREEIPYGMSREQLQEHFSYNLENHYWLEEVVIRKTVEKKEMSIADLALNKRKARPEDIEMAFDMEDMEEIVRKPNPDNYPVYYVVDGMLQFTYEDRDTTFPVMIPDYGYAHNIRPEEIESYTVVTGQEVQALYGYGIMYVIDVKTKPLSGRPNSNWINPLTISDFSVTKEFYKPRYDTDELRYSSVPDLRKTIHWEPDLQFGENGEATVTFYNGDRYTQIKCVVEGITEEGVPVHAEHIYRVSLTRE